MELMKIIDRLEQKLLEYKPLKDIYYVERHTFSFDGVIGLNDLISDNWDKICNNFVNVLKVLRKYIDSDDYLDNDESNINEDIFDLNEISGTIYYQDYGKNDKEHIAKITLLLNLYSCCVVPQGNPEKLLEDGTLIYKYGNNTFFRGEDNYDYSLLPSIYRNEDFGENGKTLNYSTFLFPYYYKDLINKYNEFQDYIDISYDFCSLMQYAGCKSPLLDITKDSKIAVSFASSSNQEIDGSLYVFSGIKDVQSLEEMRKISVFAINRKLDFLTVVRKTPILLCGIDKFEVDLKLLTSQTNDRMKFQKGAFLFINKCIIVNNKLLLPINNKKINKYRISADYKKKYISSLGKRYQQKYLMNPYLFLKED